MSKKLGQAITEVVVRRLAGEQLYQRGLDYFSHGHVESLELGGDNLKAVVRGDQDYTVTLTGEDGILDYSCDCPAGSKGIFCKHCAATALAWLNRAAEGSKSAKRPKPKKVTLAGAGEILRNEDKETLVGMLLEWAKGDARLRESIILYAARRAGPESGAVAVRDAFEKAVRVRGYLDFRQASVWVRNVDRAIDSIEQLLSEGQAAAVIGLCESGLRSLLKSIQSVDDSNGHFGELRDRLEEIHLEACQEARPDPAGLAARLFDFELRSDFDVFFGAIERYKGILGVKGTKVYRELAEAEWTKVPVRNAGQERFEKQSYFRITHIMESLARTSGDVEALVAVMSRDLSSAYSYWKIAEVYGEARQHDNALIWAEKGLKAFPERTDSRLREFAAEEYHRVKRHDDAMTLMWAHFSEHPSLDGFAKLEKHAKMAGAWPEWRERALADIRARIAKSKQSARDKTQPFWIHSRAADHSELVEIFLHERDVDEAWAEAQKGGCSDSLWLRLGNAREKEHPEDAAALYLKLAEADIAATSNGQYEEPVSLLMKGADVMKRLNRSAEFVSRLEGLRTKYKPKRNFIRLIEEKRKSLYL